MPTYIDIINYFHAVRRARRDIIGEREILLFLILADAANRQGWQAGGVEVSTESLCFELSCEKMGVTRSRDKLKDAGLVTFEKGNRCKCPRYFIQACYSNSPKPVTPSKDRQTDKTEREGADSDSLFFDNLVSQMETEFPRRADVRTIAQKLLDHGGKFTATRLKHWIKSEKPPKFKQAEKPKMPEEPEGWQKLMPGALGERSWEHVCKHYPEEAKRAREKLEGGDVT